MLVTNVRGIHGAPVSEATIAYMLSLARDMPRSVRAQENSKWERWPSALLAGKTVGILGVGLIAEYLAPICKTLHMTVVGISGSPRETKGFDRMAHRDDLVKIAPDLDFLVALDPAHSRNARHRRRKGIRGHETERVSGQCRARRRRRRAGIDRCARGRENCRRRARCVFAGAIAGRAARYGRPKNVTIFSHLGGYSQGYEDRAMPTIAGNMAKFLSGDLKSMINIVRKPASWRD